MRKVLVTGGAGYIGSMLTRLLIKEGFAVRVLDNLLFGSQSLISLMKVNRFDLMEGDIRDKADVDKALCDMDYVVHLAAIVGDPACVKFRDAAESTNIDGSMLLYEYSKKHEIKRFIFISTCSNYGKMDNTNSYMDENSQIRPLSLYAKTKVEFESFLTENSRNGNPATTILRFATAYGLSYRMRFDLTVNEFTKELTLGRKLDVYGMDYWRPYAHVTDLSRSIFTVMTADPEKTNFNIFNAGETSENYTKGMIIGKILDRIPGSKINPVKCQEDPRDYKVSFEKIKHELGFRCIKTVDDGINQVIEAVRSNSIPEIDDIRYRNS